MIFGGKLKPQKVLVMQSVPSEVQRRAEKTENGQRALKNNQQKSLKGFTHRCDMMRLAALQNSVC